MFKYGKIKSLEMVIDGAGLLIYLGEHAKALVSSIHFWIISRPLCTYMYQKLKVLRIIPKKQVFALTNRGIVPI